MSSKANGLRERKKNASRLAISQIATKMFIDRGFENVTVVEVAAAADVSVATIFNYFPTKEDLFFDRELEIIEAHARFVRERKKSESITQALHREARNAIATALPPLFNGNVGAFLATVDASPALRARVRLALEKTEATLAAAIADSTKAKDGDPKPRVVAAMMMAIERVLLEKVRGNIFRGDGIAMSKRSLLRECDVAFELMSAGVGAYGKTSR